MASGGPGGGLGGGDPAAARVRPQAQAAKRLLDNLLLQTAASVRPANESEQGDINGGSASAKRSLKQRQEAESLLVVGDTINSPALRQQPGGLWEALAAELDARLVDVLQRDPYGDSMWDGDQSMLHSALKERPNAAQAHVKSSMGGSSMGKVGVMDELMNMLGRWAGGAGNAAQLAVAQAAMVSEMVPTASAHRPPLACAVSRFDASYAGPTAGDGDTPGAALAEARCEVTCEEHGSGGQVAAAGDLLAYAGGTGWKQRSPYLEAGRIGDLSSGEPFGQRMRSVTTGFMDRGCGVALDPPRSLVWASGGEDRYKAFKLGAEGHSACKFTLCPGDGGVLLGVLGGRLLGGLADGVVECWDIERLTPQREWIDAGLVYNMDSDEAEAQYGVEVLCGYDGAWNAEDEEAEATAGETAHGRVLLLDGQGATGSGSYTRGRGQVVSHVLPVGPAEGDADPQQVVVCMEHSPSLWVYDWPTASLAALLTGHGGAVIDASTAPTLPHLVAAGSWDGSVRVWDLRAHAACTHLLTGKGDKGVAAVALAEDQGQPFCFSSCHGDEAVVCWDLRMAGRCLYELATGNTDVVSLHVILCCDD